MKNALMTLFFLCSLAATQLAAQSCAPCPPGCCEKLCTTNDKSAAVAQKACSPEATAACTPAQIAACKAAGKSCTTTSSAKIAVATPDGKAQATQASAPQNTPACKKADDKLALKQED